MTFAKAWVMGVRGAAGCHRPPCMALLGLGVELRMATRLGDLDSLWQAKLGVCGAARSWSQPGSMPTCLSARGLHPFEHAARDKHKKAPSKLSPGTPAGVSTSTTSHNDNGLTSPTAREQGEQMDMPNTVCQLFRVSGFRQMSQSPASTITVPRTKWQEHEATWETQ